MYVQIRSATATGSTASLAAPSRHSTFHNTAFRGFGPRAWSWSVVFANPLTDSSQLTAHFCLRKQSPARRQSRRDPPALLQAYRRMPRGSKARHLALACSTCHRGLWGRRCTGNGCEQTRASDGSMAERQIRATRQQSMGAYLRAECRRTLWSSSLAAARRQRWRSSAGLLSPADSPSC